MNDNFDHHESEFDYLDNFDNTDYIDNLANIDYLDSIDYYE
jgi:hypothetical protein